MVYQPEENDSELYEFIPEMFMIPPMDGFLRRMLAARWGLILVSSPDHVDRGEVLDFLANLVIQQDFYSEFSAEVGEFENLEKEQRQLKSLDDVMGEAAEVIDEVNHEENGIDEIPDKFSRNSDVVFVKKLTTENVAGTIEQAMGGRLVVAGIEADGSFPALGNFLRLSGSPHLVAASLMGIIGLNTVAMICPECKMQVEINTAETGLLLMGNEPEVFISYTGRGCEHCDNTGLKGRLLINESCEISEKLRTAIKDGIPLRQLRILAKHEGMRTLLDAAWNLVESGVISIDELSRIANITDPEADKPANL